MNRDDQQPVSLTRAGAARVGAAARWVERLDRAPVNLTPGTAAGVGRDGETAVWPARVTALPTDSLSDPELAELYFGVVYLPDATTGSRFTEYECWIRPIPGAALAVADTGLARLTGWKPASAGNEGKPIYTLVPGESSCTGYRTRCVSGALIRERCVSEESSGGSGEADETNPDRKWVLDAVLGTCDPRAPTPGGSSGSSGTSGGSGAPPIDQQPGAAPVRFPFVRKVCPGEGPCQTITHGGGEQANVLPASWLVLIDAGDDMAAHLPPWSPGLVFRFIRVSEGGQEVSIVPEAGETINGASEFILGTTQYYSVEIEAGCEEGQWFAITGPPGAAGEAGATGAAGAKWFSGSGAPGGGTGINGDYYLNTANGDVHSKSGGAWSLVGNIKGATGATGTPGTNGTNGAGLDPGFCSVFAGTSAPSGWLACDGSAVSRTTYASLFAAIGTQHGAGNGSTTFNVPDWRGRSVIGAGTGSGLTARSVGQTGGNETHTLSTGEMPSHTHSLPTASATLGAGTTGYSSTTPTNTISGFSTTSGSAGSGTAHNNMQPFGVGLWCIKT